MRDWFWQDSRIYFQSSVFGSKPKALVLRPVFKTCSVSLHSCSIDWSLLMTMTARVFIYFLWLDGNDRIQQTWTELCRGEINKGLDAMDQEQLLLEIVIKLNFNTFHRSMTSYIFQQEGIAWQSSTDFFSFAILIEIQIKTDLNNKKKYDFSSNINLIIFNKLPIHKVVKL